MKIELLWFQGCPNHEAAEEMVRSVLARHRVPAEIARVEVPDLETGNRVTFSGSPTIRVNGIDVEPGWAPCEDCTPRCRLYFTSRGFSGLPEREWIESAVLSAMS